MLACQEGPGCAMPCDVPAHAFDQVPEVQVVHLEDRYILVLSAGQVVGKNASTAALYGWGWADESYDALGDEIYRAGMQHRFRDITIYRRTDGVMGAASNAGQRRKLMTCADRVQYGPVYYDNQDETHHGETWHCSRLRSTMPVRLVPSTRVQALAPAHSSTYGPVPRTSQSRDRQQRLERAEQALLTMTDAVASLNREVSHLQQFLAELRQTG